MDYKDRLNELVQQEIEGRQAEAHRKSSFEGQQRASFKKLAEPLAEIMEAGLSVIQAATLSESSAEIYIGYAAGRQIIYRLEPSSCGKYSSSPSSKPGYTSEIETIYPNINERTTKFLDFPNVETVLDHLMKLVAEAAADSQIK
jgi:hypothetical protein